MPADRFNLLTPPRGASRVATLTWVRRQEILVGCLLLIAAVALVDGPLRWVVGGAALLNLSPWPGAAVLVRRARAAPASPPLPAAQQRELAARHGRRVIGASGVIGAVVGLLTGGVVSAAVVGIAMVVASWWGWRIAARRQEDERA